MVKKRDLITAVLITFCLTASMFLVQLVRSQTLGQYDPWLDITDDGKIQIDDVAWVAKAFGTSGNLTRDVNVTNFPLNQNVNVTNFPSNQNVNVTNLPSNQNVNVTNWPQDRPLALKKGVDRIILVQAMDGGTSNGYALSLGKGNMVVPGWPWVYLVYDFEPKGQMVNVTEIYLNIIWRGDVAGSAGNPHNVSMRFYNGPLSESNFDTIDLSVLGQPWDTMPMGPFMWNAVSDYKSGFNYTVIQPGMNLVELLRSDNYGDHIFIFSLEIFIEYYYWG